MTDIKRKILKIEELKFDEMNPRLPNRLLGITEELKVIDYMVKNGNILELMRSISEMGYSEAEPILVVLDGEDQKYIVVEGNRRLTAVKLLNDPCLAKVRIASIQEIVKEAKFIPMEIPVIQYDSRKEILDYLGYRHITGVKEWGALEKARYLDQLYQTHYTVENKGCIYKELAKMIGSKSDYVRKLHNALKLYNIANDEAYYGAEVDEKDISFSWITTALGYTEIVDFINLTDDFEKLNRDNYKDIFLWMFDPKQKVIGDSREISKLASIVAQETSLNKLKKGSSIDDAILYTSVPSEAFMDMLKSARKSLKQAKDAIEQLSEEPGGSRDILNEISKIVKSISGGLDSNFAEDDDIDFPNNISKEDLRKLLQMIGKSEE